MLEQRASISTVTGGNVSATGEREREREGMKDEEPKKEDKDPRGFVRCTFLITGPMTHPV